MIAKGKHLAVLLPGLIYAIAAVPASADILYNNITTNAPPSNPGSYGFGAANINYGYSVANSFVLSQDSVLGSAAVGLWAWGVTGTVTSVDWAITTAPFGGVTEASGTATNMPSTLIVSNPSWYPGVSIYQETLSLSNLQLAAGTYWLQLGNAVNPTIDPRSGEGVVGWDDAFTSIHQPTPTAYQFNLNVGGPSYTYPYVSSTFQILGSAAPSSAVPEPSSVMLLGTLLAGSACFIRRKRLF